MIFTENPLPGSYVITPTPFTDERGWFARTYCEAEFEKIGHHKSWKQMNHSFTKQKGTIRGMHYQLPPYGEIKLVRCVHGAVYDVIVDIRQNSPTFLQWFGTTLSAGNKNMMYIPVGFAHGFQTLEDDCELIYQHSEFYVPNSEAGIRYNDDLVKIEWPLDVLSISDRDLNHPPLNLNFKGI
ncbi:dTDP-4-dehydrorhamnose 3,5-epimerase [Mucilaginibacter jinjuensis]|uniref:dTDP-4-dehydrorhamnose 3,5-epimerase n=1 Tax=Mucilaginibacter jinjuensis TaxID=1176721 RepID=A0ABY7T4A0_9SPHI|nr:dTDP-4-dehydrorhamnose 3,5-epimerase [Mucilaginibacter jinjuensis]WCT10613.1 dTDP-4-dehydrorhamnose 3,5-epimerase [Mucilaginibacter jinjuensis]